jgi:hypothetical protein
MFEAPENLNKGIKVITTSRVHGRNGRSMMQTTPMSGGKKTARKHDAMLHGRGGSLNTSAIPFHIQQTHLGGDSVFRGQARDPRSPSATNDYCQAGPGKLGWSEGKSGKLRTPEAPSPVIGFRCFQPMAGSYFTSRRPFVFGRRSIRRIETHADFETSLADFE